MNFEFSDKRIAGLLTVVPANERLFVEEMRNFNFPEARSLKLKEVMGYNKRRVVKPGVCVSDLAVFGLEEMFRRGFIEKDEIDALILMTVTPDHPMPPTSNLIQARLGLKQDMLCLDIAQACAGFVVGLIEAFLLLEQPSVRKVVLINADVISRKASPRDRNIYPLIGDAAAITVLERGDSGGVIYANSKTDGARGDALIIPAGGMRLPSSPETAVLEDVGDNNLRAKDHLRMDGTAIFNFVQVEVPPMIESLAARAGITLADVDYFLCHQPNRFMLEKLADKMKVPHDRMPNNVVENFGNSGSATIPTVIALNLREKLMKGRQRVCLAGFGGGLSWASMLLQMGDLRFCELLDCP